MSKKEVFSKNAPAVVGPYSQAIITDSFVFCSGQIGVNPKTGDFVGNTVEEQTKQVMKNLQQVLKEAGVGIEDIIKTTVYLLNMSEFVKMNEVYAEFFQKPYPARATIEVSALPKGALVEIECIAVIKS